jgi:hypothetical protein
MAGSVVRLGLLVAAAALPCSAFFAPVALGRAAPRAARGAAQKNVCVHAPELGAAQRAPSIVLALSASGIPRMPPPPPPKKAAGAAGASHEKIKDPQLQAGAWREELGLGMMHFWRACGCGVLLARLISPPPACQPRHTRNRTLCRDALTPPAAAATVAANPTAQTRSKLCASAVHQMPYTPTPACLLVYSLTRTRTQISTGLNRLSSSVTGSGAGGGGKMVRGKKWGEFEPESRAKRCRFSKISFPSTCPLSFVGSMN